MRRWLPVIAVALLSTSALADHLTTLARPRRLWRQPLGLEGQVGLGAPLGYVGAAVSTDLARWLAVEGGIGLGAAGTQVSGMLRFRSTAEGSADGLGVGVSGGAFHYEEIIGVPFTAAPPTRDWTRAYFANLEYFHESRAENGVRSRLFIGLARLLNPNACEDCDASNRSANGTLLLYLGFGVGFGLGS